MFFMMFISSIFARMSSVDIEKAYPEMMCLKKYKHDLDKKYRKGAIMSATLSGYKKCSQSRLPYKPLIIVTVPPFSETT